MDFWHFNGPLLQVGNKNAIEQLQNVSLVLESRYGFATYWQLHQRHRGVLDTESGFHRMCGVLSLISLRNSDTECNLFSFSVTPPDFLF